MLKRLMRIGLGLASLFVVLLFVGCAHTIQDGPPTYYKDVSKIPDAKPRKLPKSAYGNPSVYHVAGRSYHVLASARGYSKRGVASWYGTKFHGKLTSSHEPYDLYAMTAASTDLPIPSFVRVTNLENRKTVIVKVNDRGPFASNRIIDLSYAAAMKLGYAGKGTAFVQVTAINLDDREPHRPFHYVRVVSHSRSGVYLQLGAFRSFGNAKTMQNRASAYVHQPILITRNGSHQSPLYRVLVGPMINTESHRLQTQLRRLGFDKVLLVAG